jgi:hypothetical protein
LVQPVGCSGPTVEGDLANAPIGGSNVEEERTAQVIPQRAFRRAADVANATEIAQYFRIATL